MTPASHLRCDSIGYFMGDFARCLVTCGLVHSTAADVQLALGGVFDSMHRAMLLAIFSSLQTFRQALVNV